MSSICNKPPVVDPGFSAHRDLYQRVDDPIATGSAHFMRAGSELHLMHSDLELNDRRQAVVRASCAAAAVKAALTEYRTSHRIAQELGFYAVHDDLLRSAGDGTVPVHETLGGAHDADLVDLPESEVDALARRYADGGDEAAFGHFLSALTELSTELDGFAEEAVTASPADVQRFAWRAITRFDRIRAYGQAMAVINILGTARMVTAGATDGRRTDG
ncbi:hypothetical protein ACFQVC_26780 [Streptomyces monticola]|uniref:Uncharacterized protein n=1 Tax=Streptomyces monticola TaxID=2666263 RepID=A0ABW2JQ14_9ACTN